EAASRPKDPLVRVELARMYLWQAQRPAAISELQTAMKVSPGHPESYVLMADIDSADNKTDDPMQMLAAASSKPAVDSDLLVRIGMIYERLQRWNEARSSYERALQFDGSNAIAKNNLAWVLSEHNGDMNVALTLAQQAKEKLVDNLEVTDTLGWIYYKR